MNLSASDMRKVVESYISAFTTQDVDKIIAIFADKAIIEDPVGTAPKSGRATIREFYRGALASGAQLEMSGPVRCAGDCAAFPFRVLLTMAGHRSQIDVIDIFRFDSEGNVIEMRAFWGPDNITASTDITRGNDTTQAVGIARETGISKGADVPRPSDG